MSDYLDLMNPKKRFTATATYWDDRPDSAIDRNGAKKFFFEYVEPHTVAYKNLFSNFQSYNDNGEIAIRTNTQIDFKNGGYVMTPDGNLYEIILIMQDFATSSKQAQRFMNIPLGTEYLLRARRVQNPWGVR